MAKIKGTIVVDIDKCKGCGVCVPSCSTKTIALGREVNGKGYNYMQAVNPDTCTGCTNCATVCPDTVITVYRVRVEE